MAKKDKKELKDGSVKMTEAEVKTSEEPEEIRHLVRVMNTDLQGSKQVQYALTGIPGIGIRVSKIIAKNAGVDPTETIGYLPDEDIEKLDKAILEYENTAPEWMLNRRKDIMTGDNKHLLGTDILMTFKEDINNLKKIRAYRGLRHERGLKVRGQRTKGTGRHGTIVGVSKRRG